jgi:diacylglycerol kinase family enzyme
MRRMLVLLNARAGVLIDRGTADLQDIVRRALAGAAREIDVELAQGKAIVRAIEAAARGPHDALVVGGGDGSVSVAARALAGSGKALGVLPLGTLNLLGKDLGMPPGLKDALAALAATEPRQIDLASVNGRPFHTLSGIGFFSQMAQAREEARGVWAGRAFGVCLAFVRAVRRTGRFTLDLEIDGRPQQFDAFAALVTNNRFGADWRRARLDEGVLEIHVAEEQGALARIGAGVNLVTGGWRESEGIRSFTAREVVIGHRRRRAWVATDGERMRERLPLRYRIEPKALTVLRLPAAATG